MVFQGPPPGRYGKHTHACALYTSTHLSATSSIATFVFIWVCGPGFSWTSTSLFHQMCCSLWERWFAATVLTDFRAFLCVTQPSKSTRSWPSKLRHHGKPWAESKECAPVKTFLREAETKTVGRGGNPLVQQKKSAQGIHCLLLCPCACVGSH